MKFINAIGEIWMPLMLTAYAVFGITLIYEYIQSRKRKSKKASNDKQEGESK